MTQCFRRFALFSALVISASVLANASKPYEGEVHWSYEGERGPASWGKIDKQFEQCLQGREQSPIDLRWRKPSKGRSISFHYNESPAKIVDNGHTVQVNFSPGSKVDIDGKFYDLVNFHFHSKSEHTLSGKQFPLEIHFVHRNDQNHLAVVGVFFKEGVNNPWIEKLWKDIPKTKGVETPTVHAKFNPHELIPKSTTHYHYMGSLTTPPCSEGVNWNVMNTPIEISKEQIEAFQRLYPANNRPIQKLNSRKPANY